MKKHILFSLAFAAGTISLYAQSGNVGIGTTTPAAKLHVKASSSSNQYFRISAPNDTTRLTVTDIPTIIGSSTDLTLRPSDGSSGLTFYSTPINLAFSTIRATKPLALESAGLLEIRSGTNRFAFASGSHQARLYDGDFGLGLNFNTDTIQARMDIRTAATDSTNAFRLRNSAYAPLLNILNNGNTGIGTSAPTAKLHVAGSVRIVDGTEGLNKIFSSDADGTGSWKTSAELGLGGGNSGWALGGNSLAGSEILGSTNAQPLRIVTDSIERMRVTETGNVGIGVATPTAKLHTKGASSNNFFRVSDNIDSTRLLLSNGFLGGTSLRVASQDNSGTITLAASAGTNNSLNSTKHLNINVDSTIGFRSGLNDFIFTNGISAKVMRLLNGNLFVGSTSDNQNIATTRVQIHNSVGDHALAIGGAAPSIRFYGGDTLPGVGPVTFDVPYAKIGLVTQAGQFANSAVPGDLVIQTVDTNKSIIFSNLFGGGNGAEQMRLNGNGNLGIGTTAPTAKLHVAGNVRIADGTQGASKILTSDANGLASWQPGIVDPSAPGMAAPYVNATGGTDIVYNNGSGWINNTFSDLLLNEVTDTANIYDPATGIITIATDGFYYVQSSMRLINNPAGSTFDGMGGTYMTQLAHRNASSDAWKAIAADNQNVLKGFGIPGGVPAYDGTANTLIYLKAGNQLKATFTTYGTNSMNDNTANIILSRNLSFLRLYKL